MSYGFFQKELFTQNVDVMRSTFKLDYNSMHAIGAFLYTVAGRLADRENLEKNLKILKSRYGIFSEFRAHLTIPMVVKMSLAEDPEVYMEGVSAAYSALSRDFMLGDESRLLAAMILYENARMEDLDRICAHTMEVYRGMKENHPWLTGQPDLPFAVLMGLQDEETERQLLTAEECYGIVEERFPISKDSVQTVSHILAIGKGSAEEKSENFLQMYDTFRECGLRLSGDSMPILAVLVNSGLSAGEAAAQTKENDEFLKRQKGFGMLGTGGDLRRMFAAAITSVNMIPEDPAVFGALSGTVLAVILAIEIAIMISVISATSHASSSSNN
jgi:hypothetical protein